MKIQGQKRGSLVFIACLLAAMASQVFAATSFSPEKDYHVIKSHVPAAGKNVSVIEFFSYGCPWCARVEPAVTAWQKNKPSVADFRRVPVLFEPGWDVYARAYYTAKAFNIEEKATPMIFDAVHTHRQHLSRGRAMQDFFYEKFKLDREAFRNTFSYSPAIDMQVAEGPKLMAEYNVVAVPTFVVNGQYEVNIEMAAGDEKRMMEIVNYLIKKSSAPQKHS